MWIVKLGGSLFDSAHLGNWLSLLAKVGPLVVVPGGGPFADQVRQAQLRRGFDDATAHIMALLAMEQFGHLLCGLQAGLIGAATRTQIAEVLERGKTPVWLPASMVMADPGIEHSWDVTSDSLAAWLTGQLGAAKLLLVKSLSLDAEGLPVERLVERGVIDARFGSYLQLPGIQAWTMAAGDYGRFEEVYQGNMAAATRILCQDAG
jgi:aspartokinase-like uncharacterized kinase